MKSLFQDNTILHDLRHFIAHNLFHAENELKMPPKKEYSSAYSDSEELAARLIQKVWRQRKVKHAILKNPYSFYLSLIPYHDEQRLLSSIMFGKHVAELRVGNNDRLQNPLLGKRVYYHRCDTITETLLKNLKKQFDLNSTHDEYIPIVLLKSTPVDEVLKLYFPKLKFKIHSKPPHTFGVLAISKTYLNLNRIKTILKSSGVIASAWEIAASIQMQVELEATPENEMSWEKGLPASKEELLENEIFKKLTLTASYEQYPTRKLAKSIKKMLEGLPEAIDTHAIQRIALMLDLTSTFYRNNYPKYAFLVYSIVHEISLALLKENDSTTLKDRFNEFRQESQETLFHFLGINSEMPASSFVAAPAISGTNAYMIALNLAKMMFTEHHEPPKIKSFKPGYYELEYLNQNRVSEDVDADIFVISAGPIVNPEGLTPGIDINKFVTQHIIQTDRTKPATILIDTTTALYKNIKLNSEVQKLVKNGELSLILFESHQKFGLIHTDQAQYGRVFGICSKKNFDEKLLQEIKENAQADFNHHVDMRIGAYISTRCRGLLEEIKQQHFTNGALLRNILVQSSLASRKVITHEDMLENINELYFFTGSTKLKNASQRTVVPRSSFGHYQSTRSGIGKLIRFSADATDHVDCLIQAAQIYLAYHFNINRLDTILLKLSRLQGPFSSEDQVLILAMMNQVIFTRDSNNLLIEKNLELYAALNYLLKECRTFLKGRQYYSTVEEYVYSLKENLEAKLKPLAPCSFFESMTILYHHGIKIDERLFKQLKSERHLNQVIVLLGKSLIPLSQGLFNDLAQIREECEQLIHEDKIKLLKENHSFFIKLNGMMNTPLVHAKTIWLLLNDSEARHAIELLMSRNITLSEQMLVECITNPSAKKFIIENHSNLDQKSLTAIFALAVVCDENNPFYQNVTNPGFRKGVTKIHNAIEDLLEHLKKTPHKYQQAEKHSVAYRKNCYSALQIFYSNPNPQIKDREEVFRALDEAKIKAFGKDQRTFSKVVRLILVGFFNSLVGILTFGIAQVVHYKITGQFFFFTPTNSSQKIETLNRSLRGDIQNCLIRQPYRTKIAVTYNPNIGGSTVLSLKKSFQDVGCEVQDADYRKMMVEIPQKEFNEKYATIEGRILLFAHAKAKAKQVLGTVDCLALSGNGAMIDPNLFNQERKHGSHYDFSRTIAELALIHEAMQRGMPVYGVCGGHQAVAVYAGGTLRDLTSSELEQQRLMNYDKIRLIVNTMLVRILEGKTSGNIPLEQEAFGAHEQIVSTLGSELKQAATSDVGVLNEAAESEFGAPILTTQFHPEVMVNGLPRGREYYHRRTAEEAKASWMIFKFVRDAGESYRKKQILNDEIKGKSTPVEKITGSQGKKTTGKRRFVEDDVLIGFCVGALVTAFFLIVCPPVGLIISLTIGLIGISMGLRALIGKSPQMRDEVQPNQKKIDRSSLPYTKRVIKELKRREEQTLKNEQQATSGSEEPQKAAVQSPAWYLLNTHARFWNTSAKSDATAEMEPLPSRQACSLTKQISLNT